MTFDWTFPYLPIPAKRALPVLRTWLALPGAPVWEVALAFDSGAELSLVSGQDAVLRGFDPVVDAKRIEPVQGIGGASTVYVHDVSCQIVATGLSDDASLRFTLPVAFSDPQRPSPPLNVLGREGFLDRFSVAIVGHLLPPRLHLARVRT